MNSRMVKLNKKITINSIRQTLSAEFRPIQQNQIPQTLSAEFNNLQNLEREGCKMKSKTVKLEIGQGLKELRGMLA